MDGENQLRIVESNARRGAMAVTHSAQVVRDAVETTVVRWYSVAMHGRHPGSLMAWAYRVGANAAKKAGASRASSRKWTRLPEELAWNEDGAGLPAGLIEAIEHIRRLARSFRGRQYSVLRKMAEPGMTLHRAARDLRMDRHSLRRSFHSGLAVCMRAIQRSCQ